MPAPLPTASPTPAPSTISIADALARGGTVSVAGVVTAGPSLIDTSGRLVVIQDQSAAVEVRLPAANANGLAGLAGRRVGPGMSLRIKGSVGRAFGAPRITASTVTWLSQVAQPVPLRITAVPGAGLEWRLVIASGRLDSIHRLGLRWRAELIVGGTRIPIVGLTGAGIGVGRLFPDRRVTIVGIVRRAYPTAIDRRYAIEPRSFGDVTFGPADPAPAKATGGATGGGGSSGTVLGAGAASSSTAPAAAVEPTVDLRDLGSLTGRVVQVSGIVTRVDGSIVSLDDGTAIGRLMLTGEAAAFLDLVEVGDPLEVDGRVSADGSGPFLLVTDPKGVRQAGDPGGDPGPGAASPQPPAASGVLGSGLETPDTRQIEPGLAENGTSGSANPGLAVLLEALAMALLGAILALTIAVPLVRRRARQPPSGGSPGGSPRTVHARPELTLVRARVYPRPSFAPAKRYASEDQVLPNADHRVALPAGERQYHIGLGPGDLAEYILLPGDPDRTQRIATRLENIEGEWRHREFASVTGTYRGERVSVVSTGIGTDNVEIVVAEILAITERPTFIRVGSCGALQPEIAVGDLIISSGSVRLEATTSFFVHDGYPAVADYEAVAALVEAAAKLGHRAHVGITATAPGFFGAQGRPIPQLPIRYPDLAEEMARQRVLNFEMEASALLVLAGLAGCRAGVVCAVYAHRPSGDFATGEARSRAEAACVETGLEGLRILAAMERQKRSAGTDRWRPSLWNGT